MELIITVRSSRGKTDMWCHCDRLYLFNNSEKNSPGFITKLCQPKFVLFAFFLQRMKQLKEYVGIS
jgi:hypothetical protein